MKVIRNLMGKKVCTIGNKKVEIVFHGFKTIIDYSNQINQKLLINANNY